MNVKMLYEKVNHYSIKCISMHLHLQHVARAKLVIQPETARHLTTNAALFRRLRMRKTLHHVLPGFHRNRRRED